MKAIVYHEYGSPDVLRCEVVPKPTPGDGEVLIRIRAAAANPLDWRLMRGTPYVARIKTACANQRTHDSALMWPARLKRLAGT